MPHVRPVTLLVSTLLTALVILLPGSARAEPGPGAYVLLYHHVARDTPASTSVSPEQFAVHMEHLEKEGYRVVPLERLLEAVERGHDIEPGSVAITFDDAYVSVFENALPVLAHREWPFTVFASTSVIDNNPRTYMSWEQLRALERRGATIGNHGHLHQHMLARAPGESADDWSHRISLDIRHAQELLDNALERPAKILAYPYGEFDATLVALVRDLGFRAVGQQSGPIGAATLPQAAPRFPMATGYADLESFSEKLNTLALPVTRPRVPATLLTGGTEAVLELAIGSGPLRLQQLTCFVSRQESPALEWLEKTHLRVTPRAPLPAGRSKTTYTVPHESEYGVYYWYTHLWMQLRPDRTWYDG